jgi:hypothetical protein
VSDQLLTILKFVLLALVWLFFLRVLRAVWAEIRRDRPPSGHRAGAGARAVGRDAVAVGQAGAGTPAGPAGQARREPLVGAAAASPRMAAASGLAPAGPVHDRVATGSTHEAANGGGQQLRLAVLSPAELQGRSFDLGDQLTVGRSTDCGVCVAEDGFISQLHARFFAQGGKLWVEDLGSTNGTYLNTRRLTQPAPLRSGDRLQMGRTVFEVSQ